MWIGSTKRRWLAILVVPSFLAGACAPLAPGQPGAGRAAENSPPPAKPKILVASIIGGVEAMAHAGNTTTSGGWQSYLEVYANGLVTTEEKTRTAIPRLATELPSLDKGTIEILPDGKMRTTYRLRRDVTWHDGTGLTAHDLVFTQRVLGDRRLPSLDSVGGAHLMESSEAPDDYTFVTHWKSPYYQAGILGVRNFFFLPRHVMEPVYEEFLATGDPQVYLTHRYWNTDFIHTGPFRLAEFLPAERTVFERYEPYFVGRPKLDKIIVQTFGDANTLLANLLSGDVQMVMDTTFATEQGLQLKERWESEGTGVVYSKPANSWFLAAQHKDGVQKEPANLQIPVRRALYHAIDRAALVDALLGGQRDLVADTFISADHPMYPFAEGILNQFNYDPDRAKAMLRQEGWTPGPDGILRHASDGRRYQTSIWGTPARANETAAFADQWRRVGLDVEEFSIPAARVRDNAFRASLSGWESSSAGSGDRIFNRLALPVQGVISRTSYVNPEADQLRLRYVTSLAQEDQGRSVRAIADLWIRELPVLVTYFLPQQLGVYRGVRALHDDWQGGFEGSLSYGTFSRNAHLWDIE